MKRTLVDRLVGFFSPEAELKRIRARGKTEMLKRAYDAAQTFSTDDWVSATGGSANAETRGAQTTLRNKGRDAIRNNPFAKKGLTTIVSNTVGSGLVPNIKGRTKLQTKRIKDAWKEWAETTLVDANRRHNFYGLQALVVSSTVESGEVLFEREVSKDGFHIRILESDFLVSNKETTIAENGNRVIQGIELDKYDKVVAYYVYQTHPGEVYSRIKERRVPAEKMGHVFMQERPGQVRGVSWFHPVIRQLQDFNEYQQSTLISRKVGACYSVFVTSNDQDSTLSASDLQAKREAESMLSPGSIRYLQNGEQVQIATPPTISGYDEFCRQTLRAIASGLGITYESLTSDYSQVNFSSGRMGHLEFRNNVERWRWQMLVPQFCEPSFKYFLEWCQIAKGINVDGVSAEWICPSWALIDPEKEISATIKQIRNGLISRQKAILELGYDPHQLNEEIAESNKTLDELEIVLDSDPRKTTQAGLLQITPGQETNGQPNSENVGNLSDTESGEQ